MDKVNKFPAFKGFISLKTGMKQIRSKNKQNNSY